jgi:uncharacterized membrane protein YeaQ/YmgE (transglycosylase-associated protein family)
MDNIVFLLVVGVVAGALAKLVVPGEAPGGILSDFVVGIAGSVTGGFLFNTFLGHTYGGLAGSIGVAFFGAIVF